MESLVFLVINQGLTKHRLTFLLPQWRLSQKQLRALVSKASGREGVPKAQRTAALHRCSGQAADVTQPAWQSVRGAGLGRSASLAVGDCPR